MLDKKTISSQDNLLRQRAEEIVHEKANQLQAGFEDLSSKNIQQTFHELQVHQIELEMQNEELRRTQAELGASRERYFDLYNLAPVGYCTISEKGLILEANLTAAELLGVSRHAMVNQLLTRFILKEDQDIYYKYRRQFFREAQFIEKGILQGCDLRIKYKDEMARNVWVHLVATAVQGMDGEQVFRVVLNNITERKQVEEEIIQLNLKLEKRIKERTAELENKIDDLEETQESLQKLFASYQIVADNTYDWEYWQDLDGQFLYCSPSCKWITGYDAEEFISDPTLLVRIIHPEDLPDWQKYIAAIPTENNGRQIEFRIRRADGSQSWIGHVAIQVYDTKGRPLGIRGSNRDINERKNAENNIRIQAARAEALLRVASHLNTQQDLETLLKTVCHEAAVGLCAPASWINLYDSNQDTLCFAGDYAMPQAFKEHYQPPSRALYETKTNQLGPIFVIQDVQSQIDLPNLELFTSLDIHTIANGSLQRDGRLIGVLSIVTFGEERTFSEEELALLLGMADLAAQAIINTRLFEEVTAGNHRLLVLSKALIEIQETERRNLALELHDELGQILSGVKISLDMIPALPQTAGVEQLQRASALVGDLINRVCQISLDLRPSMLDDMGLLPALRWLFKTYQTQSGEEVSFKYTGLDQRFPQQVEITAYRIVQQALTNVMRHAGNRQVKVTGWADEQFLNLQIEDHGVGFDVTAVLSKGESSGLSGMSERARLLGGEIVFDSVPGRGTSLTARLPLSFI